MALAEGIRRVQNSGRRVQLYLSADVVHSGSGLFTEQMPASTWAQWWGRDGPDQQAGAAASQHAVEMCHAYSAWQRTIADAVERTLNETGADGVRLDGVVNGHLYPCFNPAHDHDNEFATHGLLGDLAILNASLAAIARYDARTARQSLLSTEGFSDLYSLYAQAALISWAGYPKQNDISPARIYGQGYIGVTYSAYTNVARSMLDGWVASIIATAGAVATPEQRGWNALRESFARVYSAGNVSAVDPVAPASPGLGLRLYSTPSFHLLISAPMMDAARSGPSTGGPVLVSLPMPLKGMRGLSIDVTTLAATAIDVSAENSLAVSGRLEATILARPGAAVAFLSISPTRRPENATAPLAVRRGAALELSVQALRPWADTATRVRVDVSAFGLAVHPSALTLTGGAQVLRVSAAANATLGPRLLRFAASGEALPARRWVHVQQ